MIKKSLPLLLGGVGGSGSGFFSASGQGADLGRCGGFAFISVAASIVPGAAITSNFFGGTRAAESIYAAQASAVNIRQSARSTLASTAISGSLSIPAQSVDTNLQPFVGAPQIQGTTPVGSVPGNQTTFGTHAATLYNAETQKIFFDAPQPKGATPFIASTVYVSPQIIDLSSGLQPFLDAPQFNPSASISVSISAFPQAFDSNVQPFWDAPQPAGARPRLASVIFSAPQSIDLTQQPFYGVAQTAPPLTSRALSNVFGAPQLADLSLQPFLDAPPIQGTTPTGSVPGSQYTFGTHASTLYNAEAQKRFFSAPLSTTITTSGKLGQWMLAATQPIDLSPQPFVDVPQLNPSGWLMTVIGATPDQTEFLGLQTSRVSMFSATITRPGGPALGSVIEVGQQSYADAQPRLFAPLIGLLPNTGPVLTPVRAAPQLFDFTLQPVYHAPIVAGLPAPVPPIIFSPAQAYDFTLQPIYRSPTQLAASTPVSNTVVSASLATDYPIQQPQIWRIAAVLQRGPIPPLTLAAPQLADLNLQPLFVRPVIIGQGKLGSFTIAPPQQWDYTLQGTYQSPTTAAIRYSPVAPIRLSLGDYGSRLVL